VISICEGEEMNATDPDPLLHLFLVAYTPLACSYLTSPFILTQGRWSQAPASPEVNLAMAIAQILLPTFRMTDPPLTELAMEYRVPSSPPYGWRRPPGVLLRDPDLARVLALCPGGWR
jgi:hypothetical protein